MAEGWPTKQRQILTWISFGFNSSDLSVAKQIKSHDKYSWPAVNPNFIINGYIEWLDDT